MGFLEKPKLITTELGDVDEKYKGFHVVQRDKLPHGVMVDARAALITQETSIDKSGTVTGKANIPLSNEYLLAGSIVSWNLTDDEDNPLPCGTIQEKVASLARIDDESVIRKLQENVNIGKERSREEQATFRGNPAPEPDKPVSRQPETASKR